jgi:hypothetical protein
METDSEPNLIPDSWIEKNTIAGDMLSVGTGNNGNSYVFSGGAGDTRKLQQDLPGGSAGDQFQLTARVDRTAAPANAKVDIMLTVYNTDGTKLKGKLQVADGTDFSTLIDSGVITIPQAYSKIRLELRVSMNSGTVHFDEVSLIDLP